MLKSCLFPLRCEWYTCTPPGLFCRYVTERFTPTLHQSGFNDRWGMCRTLHWEGNQILWSTGKSNLSISYRLLLVEQQWAMLYKRKYCCWANLKYNFVWQFVWQHQTLPDCVTLKLHTCIAPMLFIYMIAFHVVQHLPISGFHW